MGRERDIDILARTIYGEARGETTEGMEAVAMVIMNRYEAKKWFTGYVLEDGVKTPSIEETCLKNKQFSCWNKNDVNYPKLVKVGKGDKIFESCLEIAKRAMDNRLLDFTNNATFYHTKAIKPSWAERHTPCYETGNHLFYNDIK